MGKKRPLTPALSHGEREEEAPHTPALNHGERGEEAARTPAREPDAPLTPQARSAAPALSHGEREEDLTPALTPALSQEERGEEWERGEERSGVHFLQAMGAVAWKDLAAEWRSRELLSSMLVFALLVIFIFNFALELDARMRATVTSGVLWVTFIFAGTLGLNRSMAMEKDRGCLDGLLLAPVDRTAIYFGKMISNLIFMLLVAGIVLPVYSILYNANLFHPGLLLVILLGAEGYVALGTLLAAMTVQARTRDILLPILLFPLVIPLLIAAVRASSGFLAGIPVEDFRSSINLLITFDVIFTALAFMVFEFVVEE